MSHGWWCNAKTVKARCPICGSRVFFFWCDCGSRVYFDELGSWEIHSCFENYIGIIPTPKSDDAPILPLPLKRTTKSPKSITLELKILGVKVLNPNSFSERQILDAVPKRNKLNYYYELVGEGYNMGLNNSISIITTSHRSIDEIEKYCLNRYFTFTCQELYTSTGHPFLYFDIPIPKKNEKRKKKK